MKYKIFFSSVQKEFKNERRALRDYIYGDALLGRFFEVFLFEDLPASSCRADEVYLKEVAADDIYLGLFGDQYGAVDGDGMSATHKEFLLASQRGKPRFIFVKGDNDAARHPKILALLRMAGEQLIRRRFNTTTELHSAGVSAPTFRQDGGQFVQTLWRAKKSLETIESIDQGISTRSTTRSTDPVKSVVLALKQGERSSGELRQALGIKHRPTFRKNYLHPALKASLVEITLPDKPNSRLQKYRLTEKGVIYLKKQPRAKNKKGQR